MPHRSRLSGLVIDCEGSDPSEGARFWSAALGTTAGEAEGRYVALGRVGTLSLDLQAVEHPSRVHLDIETDDQEAECARLKALGATEVSRIKSWIVMQAPTGQRFCVVKAGSPDFDETANLWEEPA